MRDTNLPKEIKTVREELRREIEAELGDILDAADLLHYYTCKWQESIARNHPVSYKVMKVPSLSREAAVQKMAAQAIETSCDLYNSLRAGLERPIQWMLRKQFETRTNALFFRFDESGYSAHRYQHWQLAAAAKLNPNDEKLQGPLEASLELFGDTLKDRTGRNADKWAELPNGKKYYSLVHRAEFVAKSMKTIWPIIELSEHDLDRLEQNDLHMYRSSNTVVHPSMIGHLNMTGLRSGLTTNNHHLMNTLHAYWEVLLPALPPSELAEEGLLWGPVTEALDEFSLTIEKRLG